jgi:hypothetical protein
MPTHTHIFGNRSNSYGHLSTANVRSWKIDVKRNCKRFEFKLGLDSGEIMIFKLDY